MVGQEQVIMQLGTVTNEACLVGGGDYLQRFQASAQGGAASRARWNACLEETAETKVARVHRTQKGTTCSERAWGHGQRAPSGIPLRTDTT